MRYCVDLGKTTCEVLFGCTSMEDTSGKYNTPSHGPRSSPSRPPPCDGIYAIKWIRQSASQSGEKVSNQISTQSDKSCGETNNPAGEKKHQPMPGPAPMVQLKWETGGRFRVSLVVFTPTITSLKCVGNLYFNRSFIHNKGSGH